jgi:Mor family transcriptional regulator
MEVMMPPQKNDGIGSKEALQRLFQRLQADFGQASGQAIIKTIIEECGGMRISLPDMQDLWREERDRRIRNKFTGANHEELAINFGLSVDQVRRIVNCKRKKSKTTVA